MALTQVAGGMIASGQTITSPTLVTPALGTPASGVMTNVTSVPAAQLTGSQAIPKSTLPTGAVLQVLTDTQSGEQATTSSTFVDTALTITITPTSATSKIFLIYTGSAGTNGSPEAFLTIKRNSTNIGNGNAGLMRIWFNSSSSYNFCGMSMSILDSPATTSATTYTVQFRTPSSFVYISGGNSTDSFTAMEIAA
jgi:hypothetical protein